MHESSPFIMNFNIIVNYLWLIIDRLPYIFYFLVLYKRCGLKKMIYLVEGDPNSSEAAESIKTA